MTTTETRTQTAEVTVTARRLPRAFAAMLALAVVLTSGWHHRNAAGLAGWLLLADVLTATVLAMALSWPHFNALTSKEIR